ncbi:PIN domain-containing protein [Streptomyces sp. NPDC095817]|uniref:PIN domain-containing protein n=1 Tax=Streptomyces sp. NPDC095817 TaxID=3155082 RepID=UPI00331F0ED8
MLITPRPGTNRDNLLQTLQAVHLEAFNEHGRGYENGYKRLLSYLEWAMSAARRLRNQITSDDLNALVLTERHDTLLNGIGDLEGSRRERLVNLLVDQELAERTEALQAAIHLLESLARRWSGGERFVVADPSFYIQNETKLSDVDLHQVLGIGEEAFIHLLFPIVVVDELDNLKDSGKQRARWRAAHTLGLLDGVLNGGTEGVLHAGTYTPQNGETCGKVTLEIVLDPPGHVRLPIADDEIVDRAVRIEGLAGREVRLLTCDTSQHTRGCAAGLKVTKVATKDPGPEPDWDEQNKPGSGTRAKRRERQAAEHGSE